MPYLKPQAVPLQQTRPSSQTSLQPKAPETPSAAPTAPVSGGDQLTVSGSGRATPLLNLNPEPSFILHKVRRGDSLSELAEKYLGSANRHLEIFQANREAMRNPNDLSIGMLLKIPAAAGVNPPPEVPEPAEETPPVSGSPAGVTEYRVKWGESLSSIALRTLGDAERYLEIYRLNRNQMKNPDDLHPGMVLKIPSAAPAQPPLRPTPQ